MTPESIASPPLPAPRRPVWEDDTALVFEKPSGLLSVPGRGPLAHDSLAQRVQAQWPEARVVHRLDMSTSGLILFALGIHWQRQFSQAFAQRAVRKTYIAHVQGHPEQDSGLIDLPLAADWPRRPLQKVDFEAGKPALTYWRVLSRDFGDKPSSRVELRPVTGRSHQLRVHLLALGHPIVGDALYADPATLAGTERLLLHASGLAFTHPGTGCAIDIQSKPEF